MKKIIICVLLLICCSCQRDDDVLHNDKFEIDENSNLPIIYIESGEINSTLSSASMKIVDTSNNIPEGQLYNGYIEIRLRGNTTALRDKHPYKIKLKNKTDLFGMGSSKHWVLLANDLDHTQIRNKLSFNLARDLGMDYTPESRFVSLVLNGKYQGVYELVEHIRVEPERVNIYDWKDVFSTEIDNNTIIYHKKDVVTNVPQTGGFLLEGNYYYYEDFLEDGEYIDWKIDDQDKMISNIFTDWHMPFKFNTPEYVYPDTDLYQYTYNYIQSFEYSLHSPDFIYHADANHYVPTNIELTKGDEGEVYWSYDLKESSYHDNQFDGYKYNDFFDMDSLVNYFLVNEITMDRDCMSNSIFLYKDIGGKAFMGPVWDFDIAFNTVKPNKGDYIVDTWRNLDTRFFKDDKRIFYRATQWYVQLCKNTEFLDAVYDKYWEVRDTAIQNMIDSVNTYRDELSYDCKKNDELWGYRYSMKQEDPDFDYNNFYLDYASLGYEEAYDFLYKFVTERIAWMDEQMSSREQFYDSIAKTLEHNKL